MRTRDARPATAGRFFCARRSRPVAATVSYLTELRAHGD